MPLWLSITVGIIGAMVFLALLPMLIVISITALSLMAHLAARVLSYPAYYVMRVGEKWAWSFVPNPSEVRVETTTPLTDEEHEFLNS